MKIQATLWDVINFCATGSDVICQKADLYVFSGVGIGCGKQDLFWDFTKLCQVALCLLAALQSKT